MFFQSYDSFDYSDGECSRFRAAFSDAFEPQTSFQISRKNLVLPSDGHTYLFADSIYV